MATFNSLIDVGMYDSLWLKTNELVRSVLTGKLRWDEPRRSLPDTRFWFRVENTQAGTKYPSTPLPRTYPSRVSIALIPLTHLSHHCYHPSHSGLRPSHRLTWIRPAREGLPLRCSRGGVQLPSSPLCVQAQASRGAYLVAGCIEAAASVMRVFSSSIIIVSCQATSHITP